MLELLKEKGKNCTGCGACYNICPVNAIQMVKNPQGFLYPAVNEQACVHCKKCEAVCPKLECAQNNKPEPDCYAARAQDEIRLCSSSGGMFTVLANEFFARSGIVCGATMEKDFSVHHIGIEQPEQLPRLQKSKYVQSNTERIYQDVAKWLQQGREVLFVGCPCQVAAMKRYIGKNAEKLYCVDILCHGVPSVQMLQDYMRENFDLSKVEGIDFRSKENGWRCDQIRLQWKDGSAQQITRGQSAYEEGFQRSISLRDGCEDCEFCGHQRQGDLTIGDFWRVREYDPTLDDGKGTSVVLVNNAKGQKLLDAVKGKLLDLRQTPISAANHNRLETTYRAHPRKERFKLLYPGHTYSTAVMQCRHSLYDIGLLGLHAARNYGGQLTQFALYSALTDMGYSVLMIERPLDSRKPPHPKHSYLFSENPYPRYALSPYFKSIAEMKSLNLQCKTFVAGSDQMFNYYLYNECGKCMSLNFVMDNHRKIAYAASFGHDRIWGEEIDRASESYFLQKFDFFSVREDSAVGLCEREFGVKATHVLDPVFLCPMPIYEKLVGVGEALIPAQPYLFAYILDPDQKKETILRSLADKNQLFICAVSDARHSQTLVKTGWTIDTAFGVSMEGWLAHIARSEFFVTDSFHGMCIAILFHRQFIVIVNKRRGETRFTSLLGQLGLEGRMVYSVNELNEKLHSLQPIDYAEVDERLNAERKRSKEWLLNAINSNPTQRKPLSGFDIVDSRCDEIMRQLGDLQSRMDHMPSVRLRANLKNAWNLSGKFWTSLKQNGYKQTWEKVKKRIAKRKAMRKAKKKAARRK